LRLNVQRGEGATLKISSLLIFFLIGSAVVLAQSPAPSFVEITTRMQVDVDGAPNAYGPPGKKTLDYELNAHRGAVKEGEIVGYITKADHRTPETQGATDPFPGYYISTSGFCDKDNPNKLDTRRYVDASKVNYVVLATVAAKAGVKLGDFVAVHSKKTHESVYAIVGDSGNSSGAEGSLALLQALGYPFIDGRAGTVAAKEIVVRYFPNSNPDHKFYSTQAAIDDQSAALGLNKEFP
jgi:hypothetical protein